MLKCFFLYSNKGHIGIKKISVFLLEAWLKLIYKEDEKYLILGLKILQLLLILLVLLILHLILIILVLSIILIIKDITQM